MPVLPLPLLLRRALLALALALPAALLALVLSSRGPVYEASGSLMAAPSDPGGRLAAAAPALPLGALEQALHSPEVVDAIVARLRPAGLDAARAASLAGELRGELAAQEFGTYALRAQLDQNQSGTYVLSARGRSPQEAKVLVDSAQDALLAWDQARAERAALTLRRSLEAYGRTVERRLATSTDPLARGALLQARQDTASRLVELEQAQQAVSGPLSRLAAAVAPARPVGGGGGREALLVFAAVFAAALALGGRLEAGLAPLLARRSAGRLLARPRGRA